nr:hypothetical protein [Tanacetum cinerariifolium]
MHTSRDDYLINTLRFISAKEETQIYGAILPESLTSPEMKEPQSYQTYLGFATGATPPKKAQKFKKPASLKLTAIPVLIKAHTGKSTRVKRHAKESTETPARGVVIRETSKMPLSKKKKKMTIEKHKGIDLLFELKKNHHKVKLNLKEMIKMIATMNKSQVMKIVIKRRTLMMTKPNQTMNSSQIQSMKLMRVNQVQSLIMMKMKKMTMMVIKQRLLIKLKEDTNAAMTNIQQGSKNPKILQVIEDAHVTLSTVLQKTEVPDTSSSHSSSLATKFLNFSDIPHTDAEIVSPLDVHIHHEVPSQQTPTLLTVPVSVISDSSL